MTKNELNNYLNVVIPNIERELTLEKNPDKLVQLYDLYSDVLYLVGPHDFVTYNKALELEEDKTQPNRGFYHHRKTHMQELFDAFNDMEVNDKYDMLLVSLPPRTGKEQPLNAKILTPYGWKTMGDMTVGQEIMGEDGQIYHVTGVFPQGIKPTYELVFTNGLRVPCGIDHLWRVRTADDVRYSKVPGRKDHHIMTTRQIKDYVEAPSTSRRLSIPFVQPMNYPTKINQEILDMYSFGVMLADGTAPFVGIPDRYLFCDLESRFDMLAGIMDRCSETARTSMTRCYLKSEAMGNSVCDLIRSFGGQAKLRYERRHNRKYWVVYYNMYHKPFYNKEKLNTFKLCQKTSGHTIKEVIYTGESECQCISVDNPTHLYVTDGFVPTHNTTTGIRFLSWIMGRYPESTQLATSFSDAITSSFYIGVMEIVQSDQFNKVFPESTLMSQNAKRQEIWLKVLKRYPSITFAPVGGSVTGRSEAEKYLYCDDLVSGIEEALSVTRLEKLWTIYSTNFSQRKKHGCKEIHLATQWSVHDPITKLRNDNADNPRCKSIAIPAYNEDLTSNFDFEGGFPYEYYLDQKNKMDSLTFDALYMCNPVEREGLLYHKEDMMTYFNLPDAQPDTIIAVCDSKGAGTDFVASPIGYVYGDLVFIEDVVFDNGLPAITIPKVANLWTQHKVVRGDIEMNNGGEYYAENVNEKIEILNGNTSIRTFFTSSNKNIKIVTYSDYVVRHFIFKDPSTYSNNSDYAKFMKNVYTWSQTTKTQVDDAPDSLAMLAKLTQDLQGNVIKVLDRKKLRV